MTLMSEILTWGSGTLVTTGMLLMGLLRATEARCPHCNHREGRHWYTFETCAPDWHKGCREEHEVWIRGQDGWLHSQRVKCNCHLTREEAVHNAHVAAKAMKARDYLPRTVSGSD